MPPPPPPIQNAAHPAAIKQGRSPVLAVVRSGHVMLYPFLLLDYHLLTQTLCRTSVPSAYTTRIHCRMQSEVLNGKEKKKEIGMLPPPLPSTHTGPADERTQPRPAIITTPMQHLPSVRACVLRIWVAWVHVDSYCRTALPPVRSYDLCIRVRIMQDRHIKASSIICVMKWVL